MVERLIRQPAKLVPFGSVSSNLTGVVAFFRTHRRYILWSVMIVVNIDVTALFNDKVDSY